jgi:hypothetical protein
MAASRSARIIAITAATVLILFAPSWGLSKANKEKTHPEQGKVLKMRMPGPDDASGADVTTQRNGRRTQVSPAGGPIYQISAETKIYEFQSRSPKDRLEIGVQVQFRIEGDFAYIKLGDKEAKYRIVGIELKPAK